MPVLQATEDLETHGQPDPSVLDCVNYDQIMAWILDCEQNHGPPCNQTEYRLETGVVADKLVDVLEHKIITAPVDARYFALSYTWGGVSQLQLRSNLVSQLSEPGSLRNYSNEIPLVIRDAMEFVANCKERYLWVDSLCIVQDDKSKYAQIERMGAIYNDAIVTLVAGTAENATAPLAGVRPSTRTPETKQPKYHNVYLIEPRVMDRISFRKPIGNDSYEYLGRLPKFQQLDLLKQLSSTTYNTRAWTYQERLLSRRCLYFMENMVYFHCRECIRGENKFAPYTRSKEQIRSLSLFKLDSIFSGDTRQFQRSLFAVYARVVKEYTLKQLSYEKDVVDAFSGITATMESICSWRFMYGSPIDLLDLALLWTPNANSDSRRRISDKYLPSWSWTGWVGQVDYNNGIRFLAGLEPFFADTISAVPCWTLHSPSGLYQLKSALTMSPIASRFQQCQQPSSANEEDPSSRKYIRNERPVLIFDALTMPVDATTFQCLCEQQTDDPDYEYHKQNFIEAHGKYVQKFHWRWARTDVQRSYLYSTKDGTFLNESSLYDLVLLSFSKRPDDELENWNYDRMRWNFMLIRWDGDLAERFAIGYSDISHFSPFTLDSMDETSLGNRMLAKWKRIALI